MSQFTTLWRNAIQMTEGITNVHFLFYPLPLQTTAVSRRHSATTTSNNNKKSNAESGQEKTIELGQKAKVVRRFDIADVKQFAALSGDHNALHLDSAFASKFNFASPIVHGALINGVVSATIGTILPGAGSILLQQDLHFPNPLYVGEQFVTEVTIANKKRHIYWCQYQCSTTDKGKIVLQGMAKILFQPAKLFVSNDFK